jgi:hypothetical protein
MKINDLPKTNLINCILMKSFTIEYVFMLGTPVRNKLNTALYKCIHRENPPLWIIFSL